MGDLTELRNLLAKPSPGVSQGKVIAINGGKAIISTPQGPVEVSIPQTGIGLLGPSLSQPSTSVVAGFTLDEKLALELQLQFKTANQSNFTELTFTSGQLTTKAIYTSPAKTLKLFNLILVYAAGQLTQTILTRISDAKTLTRNFSYDGSGFLISVDNVAA